MSTAAAPAPGPPNPVPLSRLVSFSTAGLGGILGWIVVHPFNTVAIRMNLNQSTLPVGQKPPSFVKFSSNIVQQEGVTTLYQGLSAGILRQVFYATSRFGLFEVFRDELAKYRETDLMSRLIVGVASGGAAAFISCPAEVSLVRMSNDRALPPAERRNYTSVVNAAVRIAREEGLPAFWRGSMPFVNRAMLVGATQVGTYDQFKDMYSGVGLATGTFSNVFAASFTAGLLYSIITMPFETVKNRMAFQKGSKDTLVYKTTMQSMKLIAGKEGPLALWSGFLPYYGRCGGHTVTMFVAVEWLRGLYQKYLVKQDNI